MQITELLESYNIDVRTEGHKHCREGWANMPCPFCTGNPGLHLGVHLDSFNWVCWRCGRHSAAESIKELCGIRWPKAIEIVKEYRDSPEFRPVNPVKKVNLKPFKYPSNTLSHLNEPCCKYLIKRNFDPDKLEREWNICSTGPVSLLDGIDYGNRILTPIFWHGEIVSFQTRNLRDTKDPWKYMACVEKREIVHHKDILYGKQWNWGGTGICVEGVFDVWRFGGSAFASLGIKWTRKQLRLIAKNFRRVVVVYDPEPQAQERAKEMKHQLEKDRGVETIIVTLNSDPANLLQSEADYIVKDLTKEMYII